MLSSHVRVGVALFLVLAALGHGSTARADPPPATDGQAAPQPTKRSGVALMLGLGQWALGGGNVAIQGNIGRFAFEYSHGQGVHLARLDFLRNQSEKDAGADVYETWTTGLGVGLLATKNLRLLVEFKANHYELEGGDRNSTLGYTTFTIGPGVFYDIHLWEGLFIQPSLRWWPTVHSTMPANATLARADGTQVRMTSHDSGIFPNVNIGWEL